MSQHTLLICKGCSPEQERDTPHLLDRVVEADSENPSGLTIEATSCLWTCDRPCSASFVCPGKYTYHFVDVSLDDAVDLRTFGTLYQDSPDGYVKPPKMPKSLQPKLLVRIPATPA